MNFIVKFFGLKGSWKWACKQMLCGKIVYRKTDTGSAKYKLDTENQGRICWHFTSNPISSDIWETAYIFLSDFNCTDWEIWKP